MKVGKTISEQIQELSKRCDEHLKHVAERKAKDAEEYQDRVRCRANGLLVDIYNDMWRKIYCGVGVGDVAELYVWDAYALAEDSEYATDLKRLIKESCGLNVWPDLDNERTLYVEMNLDLAKICYVPSHKSNDSDKANKDESGELYPTMLMQRAQNKEYLKMDLKPIRPGRVWDCRDICDKLELRVLDFPALVRENQKRERLWTEHLDVAAQDFARACGKAAERIPDKFYGIDQDVTLVDTVGLSLARVYVLDFGNLKVPYTNLSPNRAAEFLERVNSLIWGGEVELRQSENKIFWDTHLKRTAVLLGETIGVGFDYYSFCWKYDRTSPELQRVYDRIIEKLELRDIEEQLLNLNPVRMLQYVFRDGALDYDLLCRKFANDSVRECFYAAVRKVFPGVKPIDVQFHPRGIYVGRGWNDEPTYQKVMVLQYEIEDVENCVQLIKPQIEVEEIIAQVKQREAEYLADKVIGWILKGAKDASISNFFYDSGNPRVMQFYEFGLKFELDGDLEGREVVLAQVKDGAFLAKIDAEITKKTGGLVVTDLLSRSYYLDPSKGKRPKQV